jgi:hypothetical protein
VEHCLLTVVPVTVKNQPPFGLRPAQVSPYRPLIDPEPAGQPFPGDGMFVGESPGVV